MATILVYKHGIHIKKNGTKQKQKTMLIENWERSKLMMMKKSATRHMHASKICKQKRQHKASERAREIQTMRQPFSLVNNNIIKRR